MLFVLHRSSTDQGWASLEQTTRARVVCLRAYASRGPSAAAVIDGRMDDGDLLIEQTTRARARLAAGRELDARARRLLKLIEQVHAVQLSA